jgi:hypothetical protein
LAETNWRDYASFRGQWRPKMGLFNSLLTASLLGGSIAPLLMIGAPAAVVFKDHLPEFPGGWIGYHSPIMAKTSSQSYIKWAQHCLLPIAYHPILICL